MGTLRWRPRADNVLCLTWHFFLRRCDEILAWMP